MIMDQAATLRQQDATQLFNNVQPTHILKNESNGNDSITFFQTLVAAPKSLDLMYSPSKYAGNFPAISWDDDDSDCTSNASPFSWVGSCAERRKATSTGMVRSKALRSNLESLTHQYSSVRITPVM